MGMHFKVNSVPDPSCKSSCSNGWFSSHFLRCFGQWITVKLYYKVPQRQLSQGCTIYFLLIHIVLFVRIYVQLCRNLRINMWSDAIFDQLCGIAPSHFIRGPVYVLCMTVCPGVYDRWIHWVATVNWMWNSRTFPGLPRNILGKLKSLLYQKHFVILTCLLIQQWALHVQLQLGRVCFWGK